MNMARRKLQRAAPGRRQQGVALMVALVMLVIIGVSSVSIMRGAMNSDLIANNTRMQTLAMQAAQIALRYCEDETVDKASLVHKLPESDVEEWKTHANWDDPDKINEVPSRYMESAASTFAPSTLPQCMIQADDDLVAGKLVYQVTARGFSPDYAADDDGNTEAGSVVWLQSTLILNDS